MDGDAESLCDGLRGEIRYYHVVHKHHPVVWLVVLGAFYNSLVILNSLWESSSLCYSALHHFLSPSVGIWTIHPIIELLDVDPMLEIHVSHIIPFALNLRL